MYQSWKVVSLVAATLGGCATFLVAVPRIWNETIPFLLSKTTPAPTAPAPGRVSAPIKNDPIVQFAPIGGTSARESMSVASTRVVLTPSASGGEIAAYWVDNSSATSDMRSVDHSL